MYFLLNLRAREARDMLICGQYTRMTNYLKDPRIRFGVKEERISASANFYTSGMACRTMDKRKGGTKVQRTEACFF